MAYEPSYEVAQGDWRAAEVLDHAGTLVHKYSQYPQCVRPLLAF
jgi:hypothetical protein